MPVLLSQAEQYHSSIRKNVERQLGKCPSMFLVPPLMGNNMERAGSVCDLPLSCSLITESINLWDLIGDQVAVTWSSSM